MSEVIAETTPAADSAEGRGGVWGFIAYWGLHAWVLAYSVVMISAFYIQFVMGEFPCPLCMLQRYGMILATLGALFVIMQARRGTLTTARYAQGLGMGLLGVLAGASVSLRQIALHILPGDPGYGEPFLGLHLYTWAFITFAIVMIYVGAMLMLMPRGIPQAPAAGTTARTVSTAIIWLFIGVIAANVIAIIFLEGFALVLPDDPLSYTLIDQLTGG
ncbi:MAG: disulfide bond formation protein B [Mycobacterium sp.]|jgi:disulfide bond formation protein DsbB|nr:disulfide bond formation protein B [Mycobacterium sp.]